MSAETEPDQTRSADGAFFARVREHKVIQWAIAYLGAALALAQVATGRADASWGPGLQPWDLAAGVLLVAEAGGAVGDRSGRTGAVLVASGEVLACHPRLFEELRDLLVDVYDGT